MAGPRVAEPTLVWLRDVAVRASGHRHPPLTLERLPGHASVRTYWRATWDRPGSGIPSVVVMVLPPDAPAEEIGKGGAVGVGPFVDIQGYLDRIGVRVPALLAWSQEEGYAVLEDLGDDMVVTRLAAGVDRDPLYRTAVHQLALMRVRADQAPEPGCVAFQRGYDADVYRWELEHFVEWVLGADKQARLSGKERAVVDAQFDALARRLAVEPAGFTHRDYQSRNLMVLPGCQVVIDFQDALLGPAPYDLVSLLRDSYVALDQPFIQQMIDAYCCACDALGGPVPPEGRLREVFDLVTVQRKLKDAGRFIFIDRVKHNPDFLRFVPVALGYVRQALARLPELAELQAVLGRHVPELAAPQ